jgi:SpoVK/Ycf46/Vps4 family AAA+-type ATPase
MMDDNAFLIAAETLAGLLPELERLDHRLALATTAAAARYGPHAARDAFRGLHLDAADAARLLAQPPSAPFLTDDADASPPLAPRLAWLAQTFDLTRFDLDLLILALAPEVDLRYEQLYAYLQDDVTRRRPSVDLALNLLCSSAAAKLACRSRLAPESPLLRHHLLVLRPPSGQEASSFLNVTLQVDPQIVDVLLGQGGLDRRLAAFCTLEQPALTWDQAPVPADLPVALPTIARQARAAGQSVRFYFHGPAGGGQRQAAAALASDLGRPLLYADLARLDINADPAHVMIHANVGVLRVLWREAQFQDAVLYLDNLDTLRQSAPSLYAALAAGLATTNGPVILTGTQPWAPDPRYLTAVTVVPFAAPDAATRRAYWQTRLAAAGVSLTDGALSALASRFRLTPGQIDEAAAGAFNRAAWRAAAGDPMTEIVVDDLFAAARAQSGRELATLARKIEPMTTWHRLVLPDDVTAQLHELVQRAAAQVRVMDTWGFAQTLSRGKGTTALFAGPSGTGKTMAAEIIARDLGVDLYQIDLSSVVSKYIGETEKNLDRIFRAAEDANAVLFFDEADALFGKRSEVRDSHDRYANLEISYLLQRMEAYDGLAILATNLREHLDDAFTRRLSMIVHFPAPDEPSRRRIWQRIWPPETPLAADVNFDFLARQFKLAGGNIQNIALNAAYLAAADGGVVTMGHLRHATRREYQKMGKALSDLELGSEG